MTLPPSLLSWPPEALEHYAECASRREYLGKMPRSRAEALAEEDTRRHYAGGGDATSIAALNRNRRT